MKILNVLGIFILVLLIFFNTTKFINAISVFHSVNYNWGNATFNQTNSSTNVTLNYTIIGGSLEWAGITNYTSKTGTYLSAVYETGYINQTYATFDVINWTMKNINTSGDVMSIECIGQSNTGCDVLYRSGKISRVIGFNNISGASFKNNLFFTIFSSWDSYTGYRRDDLIGSFWQDDANQMRFRFYKDGQYTQSLVNSETVDVVEDFVIPVGFNISQIVGMATNTVTAIVVFDNCSIAYDTTDLEIQSHNPISFTSGTSTIVLPTGYSCSNIVGITRNRINQTLGIFMNNGSLVVNETNPGFATVQKITFATAYNVSYQNHTPRNLTNITLDVSSSNDSIKWSNFETLYIDSGSKIVESRIGRYFRYRTTLTTDDIFISPTLLSVEFNYTNITITNQTPSLTLYNPPDNNRTHNVTILFNFSIIDIDNDLFNFTLYADTNSNPTTSINNTINITDINATIIYTFLTEINNSINGTYYWKVNGTDNNSNLFTSSILTFNITNNRNLYNTTNVSLTALPISIGDIVG